MDITMLLLFGLVSLVLGAGIMLLAQYYIFFKLCKLPEESEEQRDINEKYSLPKDIQKTARLLNATPSTATNAMHDTSTAPLVAINFVMQFLFHELKHSNRVRKWFYRKLSLELDELIAKTTTGKLFDKLTIKELELGDQFPEIRTLRVHNVELDDNEGRIENLDLMLEIKYRGNFRTSIDADMVLGKKGSLTLMVKHLSGLARLQFTRKPYTHWSLSFLGDPELDLAVESKYQGRQMQSNITSLISNQIRKAVRRKHTLPNYKLRYKPFFNKIPEDETGDAEIQSNGLLEVKVCELSRLMCPDHISEVYCTLTMASFAFVEARQKNDRNVVVSLDVQIHKAKNQQIGIVFKQLPEHVEIEAVLPNTPACKSNLRAGDVLIAIEGRRVYTMQQVAKVVKTLQNTSITLRMERVVPGIIRNDAILEDLELYEDLGDLRTSYGPKLSVDGDISKATLSVTINSVRDRATSSESSLNNTPTGSPKKTRLIAKALKRTISRENNDSIKEAAITEELRLKAKSSIAKLEEKAKVQGVSRCPGEGVNDVEHYYQHSTVDCTLSSLICMDDLCQFKLDARCKFLNVCVYGKCPAESLLLGFVNIPIHLLLAECCETSITQCLKTFELNPPICQDLKSHPLYSQSGFDANLCFGDILFAFTWEGNPILHTTESLSRLPTIKSKVRTTSLSERSEDSGAASANAADKISLKSTSSFDASNSSSISAQSQPRAHNFIRTHFQRATQCDFCGKKIWLKDAVQCRDCFMCCHKKCINKCQNSTVCGPVDCSTVLQEPVSSSVTTPEFTVTEVGGSYGEGGGVGSDIGGADGNFISCDGGSSEGEEALTAFSGEEETHAKTTPTGGGLDVHRSSLTGLLAQSIKRVNSANNLAIPGIVSSLGNTKSLPPSPQHSPSRKPSLVNANLNPFELVTHRLESISEDVTSLTSEQISFIIEPIINISKNEDVMTMAKGAGKNLFADLPMVPFGGLAKVRVEKINQLLTKLRLALDSETAIHSTSISQKNGASPDSSPQSKAGSNREFTIVQSEERVQALSVIMLYLCTALQNAQGVALQ